ncbi:MAG TPA: AraC family transcriptional regulator [Burkholderiaceae bacterium]|nr:AraC family transcriptional regulator [Burkholderiaceae bacterium]
MLRSVQRKGQKEASAMASIGSLRTDIRDVMLGGLCRDFTDSTLITGKGQDDVGVLQLPLSGALLVSSPHGSWVVDTGSVLWLAPNTPYKLRMLGKVRLRSLHLNLRQYGDIWQQSRILHATPLMRELISEVADLYSPQEDKRVALLLAALIEEMRHNNVGKPQLPAPRDPRLVRICTHIQQQLDDAKTLQEWALELGCDPRTLHRLFVQELGMSFVQWRQHIRLRTAMDWLAAGKSVVDVAFDLGYQNQSAFTTMFRRNMGMAPSDFVKANRRNLAVPA